MSLASRLKESWKKPMSFSDYVTTIGGAVVLIGVVIGCQFVGAGVNAYETYGQLMQKQSLELPQQVGVITKVESRAEMSNGWNIFHFITRNNTRLEPLKVTTSTGTSFDITIINRKGEQLVGQQAELRPIQISEDDELIENGNYTYLYSDKANVISHKQICFKNNTNYTCGLAGPSS